MAEAERWAGLDPEVLGEIVAGTADATGEDFFARLVRHLARALGTRYAWVTEWRPVERRLRAFAFWVGDRYYGEYEYAVANTPCEPVVDDRRLVHVPDRLIELFAEDPDLGPLEAVSYMGVPLLDTGGAVLGHLAVMDTRPLPADPRAVGIFNVFASRAAGELRRLVRDRALREREDEAEHLRAELDELQGFDEIVGQSPPLRHVLADVQRVAALDTTVLITGETGTGKELIARAIHRRSPRAHRPLVAVNCAAIAPTLQESELFGHERGAFTGATQRREGRFKLADGGTLFLDEVGEMSLDLQAKLLRVLQEGEFEPVGSSRPVRVDVRVIAATNHDLAAMVPDGTFRRDLLYRLDVFPIALPPLRERGDDVLLLAEMFARRLARRRGRSVASLTQGERERLLRYPWPGNVRELQNVIERAWITSRDGRRLDLDRALPPTPVEQRPQAAVAAVAPPPGALNAEPILTDRELRELERRNVVRALEASAWKVSGPGGAAARLGVNPNTLASRLKALGISRRPAGGS